MFAQLFKCKVHGEIWNVEYTEIIDTDNDEVYSVALCPKCYREVLPIFDGGKPVCHVLTEEEMFFDMGFDQ